MGSFSWNRADNLGAIENIYGGCPFKFLIPKEFGGGFIRDKYQDYGNLGTRELPYDHAPSNKYDMFELLAFWNSEQVKPRSTQSIVHPMVLEVGAEVTIKIADYQRNEVTPAALALNGRKFTITKILNEDALQSVLVKNPFKMPNGYRLSGDAADCGIWTRQFFRDTTWYEPLPAEGLKFDGDVLPLMPEISKYTNHNRSLGIYLCYEEVQKARKEKEDGIYIERTMLSGGRSVDQGDFLKYPLKLVSASFKGTYEDCKGFSTRDPDQGFHPRRRR